MQPLPRIISDDIEYQSAKQKLISVCPVTIVILTTIERRISQLCKALNNRELQKLSGCNDIDIAVKYERVRHCVISARKHASDELPKHVLLDFGSDVPIYPYGSLLEDEGQYCILLSSLVYRGSPSEEHWARRIAMQKAKHF